MMYDCHHPTRIVLYSKLNHILSGSKYGDDVCTILSCLDRRYQTKTKIVYYFSFSMNQTFEHRVSI